MKRGFTLTKNIRFFIIGITVGLLVLLFLVTSSFIVVSNILKNTNDFPQPEITYREFPIKIEYSVNGETKIIEDVLVCRFEKTEKKSFWAWFDAGREFERVWTSELKTNKNGIVLLKNDNFTIDVSLGSANYYMGDVGSNTKYPTYPSFRVFENHTDGQMFKEFLYDEQDLKEYGIDIIECELPQPIENSFDVRDNSCPAAEKIR